MKINIVIPVLNEENSLREGVERTLEYLRSEKLHTHFSITIADNGSTDRTPDIAEELCGIYSNVSFFRVSQRGVGLAFREAIRRNTSEIIGYMDVDLATDLHHLKQVYYYFENGKKIVVGSRLLPDSKVYNRTLLREITSRSLNLILKLILHVHFSDAMCGFKFYRNDVAHELVNMCSNNNGWFYCAEMMIQSEWAGIEITEMPIEWHDDLNSKVKIGKLSCDYMREILRLYKVRRKRT